MSSLRSILFILLILAFTYLMGRRKGEIRWKFVAIGVFGQFLTAFLFLKVSFINELLLYLNELVLVIESVTAKATQFMFGFLAGGNAPFEITDPGANFVVAFRVLPLILVISAISAVLFHWRVLPFIIGLMSKLLMKVFQLSGQLGFGAAATVFFGTIEAPLLIKPYLEKMSRGELLALISCTMATIAGTVMVLYASIVGQVVENAVAHMITASVISIPAALTLSHLILPTSIAADAQSITIERTSHSTMDALIQGTIEGLNMILQIVAIIIVLFAIVYLINHCVDVMIPGGTIEKGLGFVLQPFVWLMGISWDESAVAAELMATKIILNEFVSYSQLAQLSESLSAETRTAMTYAMCGFANIASVGIVVGGLSSILPNRRSEIADLGIISIFVGNAATMMTACIYLLIS